MSAASRPTTTLGPDPKTDPSTVGGGSVGASDGASELADGDIVRASESKFWDACQLVASHGLAPLAHQSEGNASNNVKV